MEPNNNLNPTPTPNPNLVPTPNSAPAPGPAPAAPVNPGVSATPQVGAAPVNPVPVNPAPVNPAPANSAPVNPVINLGAGMQNPVIQPSGQGLAATDPIMKPEPAPAPDPVEEELKAPMKASEPVPGSIGSAVSGPSMEAAPEDFAGNPFAANAETKVNNVSFNDPATQPDGAQPSNAKPKKKTSKITLIALIIVVLLIIGALAVVLVMQMQPVSSTDSGNNNSNSNQSQPVAEEEKEVEEEILGANSVLSCSRAMSEAELAKDKTITSGTITITTTFDGRGEMKTISLVESVVTADSATAQEVINQEALASELTVADGLDYFLTANASGELDLSFKDIQASYTELDFACEVL